jgi:hypothetical protein
MIGAAAGATERSACEAQGCCWQKAAGGVLGCFEPKQASWATYEVLSSKPAGKRINHILHSQLCSITLSNCEFGVTLVGPCKASQQVREQ